MIFTLADAKEFCAKYVADGRGADDPIVVDVLNEATMILINEGDWKSTVRTIRFKVRNNSFAMPREVETILQVAIDNYPANAHSHAYEYLEGGPGILGCGNVVDFQDIVDMGDGHPTFFSMNQSLKLIAISDSSADRELTMRVRGRGLMNNEVKPIAPGEQIKIAAWTGGNEGSLDQLELVRCLSTNTFQQIASIVKPETTGYVTLYGYDSATKHMYVLGKYHPDETQPSYRRYKITGRISSTQVDCVACRVKLRYLPMKHDSDVLLIQNLPALRTMCQAIHARNMGNTQDGLVRQMDAVRMLDKQLENVKVPTNDFNVIMHMSMGDIPEMT